MSTGIQEHPDLRKLSRKVLQGDAAMSAVTAAITAVGVAVGILGTIWFGNQVWNVARAAIAVETIEISDSGPEGMKGDSPEMGENNTIGDESVSPGEENLNFSAVGPADVMSQVIDAVGEQAADLGDPVRTEGKKGGGAEGQGGGEGTKGRGWGGGGAVPPQQRWSITYTGTQTEDAYAALLDFFQIELGVLRGGNRLTYYSNLASKRPTQRNGGAAEDRLYFAWKDGGRIDADKSILKKAQVLTEGAIIVHFYPKALEAQLLAIEKKFKNREIKDIRNTKFSIRPAGRGFEFFVTDQSYI